MSEYRIDIRGAKNGTWGPWEEIRQGKRFTSRAAAERWITRRMRLIRPLFRIIPESRLRVEHRVAEVAA